MLGWWREWRIKVRQNKEKRQEAQETARVRRAEFERQEAERQNRIRLFRSCLLTAKDSDIGVVNERLHVLLLIANAPNALVMARRLIYGMPDDKRVVKAMEDLAVVVRMAHGDHALPRVIAADAEWVRREMIPEVPPMTDEQNGCARRAAPSASS
jgi:hypothetical protein